MTTQKVRSNWQLRPPFPSLSGPARRGEGRCLHWPAIWLPAPCPHHSPACPGLTAAFPPHFLPGHRLHHLSTCQTRNPSYISLQSDSILIYLNISHVGNSQGPCLSSPKRPIKVCFHFATKINFLFDEWFCRPLKARHLNWRQFYKITFFFFLLH